MFAIFRNQKFRTAGLQFCFVGILVAIIVSAVLTGSSNLEKQGITSGFGFLDRSTGFDVGYSLLEFTPFDSYGRLISVGLINTIFLGIIGIALANFIGLLIAVFRLSENAMMNYFGTIYIEIFRNIPLILQVFFWYSVLTHLPRTRNAYSIFDSVYLSARGIFIPGLNVSLGAASISICILILGLGFTFWIAWSRRFKKISERKRRWLAWGALLTSLGIGIVLFIYGRIPETPLISFPELKGLNFRGGIEIPPEFTALALCMGIYGGAYISEILRAGFLSVGRGQAEAARSLGLNPWHVFTRVRLPLAIRAILPTLINQYVWLFKATTLGIAVGFTDFFSVVSVSINQSGQTLELIAILMGGFLVMNNTISVVLNRFNKAIALRGSQLRS